ncbi:MAG TPA: IPT/TIG domain-containing protein, partial [Thermoanaerobaculia bacterium]|nr:IPT/TIG domain-containing protein [Thermoanaerobaculia bacterium]
MTYAGGIHEGFADGPAAQALFKKPAGVAVSSDGAIIVADTENHRIRRIDHGIVSTIAGTGYDGFVDGSAAVAELKQPSGVAVDDAGNVFVADSGNHAIRKVANGSVTTVAGTGTPGSADGAPATAQFKQPGGIAFAGALFVADSGNDAIRTIDPQLALSAVYPRTGDPLGGQRIRIFGSGFVPGPMQIMLGDAAATDVTFITSTEIIATTPAHALGPVDVAMTTPLGSATLANGFTYAAPPTIAAVNPTKGRTAGGQTITVSGTNFLPDTAVTLGGLAAQSVLVINSSTLTFTTPAASAGIADLIVTTSAGSATRSAAFTYFAPPAIASFSPAQGDAGTVVTVAGTNFDTDPAGDVVTVVGTPAQVTTATPTQLTIVIPSGASNGPIALITAGGTATSATDFTTSPALFKISAPTLTLAEGAAVPFAATNGTSDVTLQTTWTTSNASVVTIASNGVATGHSSGIATITATYSGKRASQDIRVEATTIPTLSPPPLDTIAAQSPADAIRFLYSGANPIQSGVAPNTIDDQRATALRGTVHDRSGAPLAGVRITVAGHPKLGQTFTRADGVFDLVVNGGGVVTLTYAKGGFITAERTLQTNALDEATVDDVVLIGYDSLANPITSGAAAAQVARGSVVTDSSGTRRATIIFPPSTTLSMQTPSGEAALPFATVRATEFSVGPNGPKAMPAALPPQSAYTYCVELSVDEAIAAGATTVEFSQPVSVYIENFLGFPVGTAVPLAFYDRAKSTWTPSDDGRVVRIISIEGGLAHVDINGDGVADDRQFSDAERQQLATLYTVGTSLWRLTTTHFSTIDPNFSSLSVNATVPTGQATWYPAATCPFTLPGNSTIECENQTLGEAVAITGAPFELHYQSDRTPGRVASRTIDVPLIAGTVPPGLRRIDLEITVAGNVTHQSFPPTPNQSFRYTWNGLDRFGRPVAGGAPAFVRTSYAFDGVYEFPPGVSASFALPSGVRSNVPARIEVSATQLQMGVLGSWNASADRLGGWSISSHDVYDPASKTLYRGDGTRKTDTPERFGTTTGIVTTVAGSGIADPRWLGTGGPATSAKIDRIEAMTVAPDGSLYLSSESFIHKVTPQGTLVRVGGQYPGNFSTGPAGNTAATANFYRPRGMAFGADGSVYVAEPYFNVIRRIAPDGGISIFAGVPGNCFACFVDNVAALQARLNFPQDVAVAPDGSVYIQDSTNQRVRRVSPDGIIRTVAGNGSRGQDAGSGPNGDGGPAVVATLGQMNGIGLGPDGSLYIAELFRIRRVGPDGIITTVAGNGTGGDSGDGGPATAASIEIGRPAGSFAFNFHAYDDAKVFSVGSDGSLYFVNFTPYQGDYTLPANSRVRRVDPHGIITTVAGLTTPSAGRAADGAFTTATDLLWVDAMTTSADGRPYLSEFLAATVRAMQPSMPSFATAGSEIKIADGSLVHVFTPQGQHLRTVDADTGAVVYTFGYTNGLLTTITDVAGNVTTVERNGGGDATAIIANGGQRTEISGAPYATSITTAPGETTQFSYTADGLMTGKIDPRNVPSTYSWNTLGLLIRDAGADGGAVDGDRSEVTDGHTVTMTTAGGRVTRYSAISPANGDQTRLTLDPAGLLTTTVRHPDSTAQTTLPDGSTVTTKENPDPLWSTGAPFTSSLTLRLPSGRSLTTTATRTATLGTAGDPFTVSARTDAVTVNGETFTRYFDRASLTDRFVSPRGRTSTMTRDTAGRLVGWSMPLITAVGMSYDSRGRLQTIAQGTRQQTFAYNTRNELTSFTDALNRTTSFAYDGAGRVTTQTLPDLREIHFTYDANGNLTSVTPPSRPAHAFSFTARNLVDTYTPPEATPGGATTYGYNVDRQLTLVTRPDSETIALGYDAAGRLGTITTSAATLGYGYDAAGRLATVSNSNGVSLGYSYDGSLLTQQQWSGAVTGSIGFTYDNDLRLGGESVAGGTTIAFGYDNDSLLTSAGMLALTRDDQTGLIAGSTIGSVTDTWSYNAFGKAATYTA